MDIVTEQKNSVSLIYVHPMSLSDKEKHLIEIVRSIECCNIEVYVQDHIPLRIEKLREKIKL